jgi:YhcH/YjgK/YiaL family protein
MIFDHLNEHGRYLKLHSKFKTAFDFLEKFEPDMPDGRYPLDGEYLYALVQSYSPMEAGGRLFEAHRLYIDLQYQALGEEIIFHSPLTRLQSSIGYAEDKDCEMFSGDAEQALVMTPGMFTILFPHDGHIPACTHRVSNEVKKVVIKIRLEQ